MSCCIRHSVGFTNLTKPGKGLEKRSSSHELFQRTQAPFPALTEQLTVISIYASWGSSALLWPSWVAGSQGGVHRHTCRHIEWYNIVITFLESLSIFLVCKFAFLLIYGKITCMSKNHFKLNIIYYHWKRSEINKAQKLAAFYDSLETLETRMFSKSLKQPGRGQWQRVSQPQAWRNTQLPAMSGDAAYWSNLGHW